MDSSLTEYCPDGQQGPCLDLEDYNEATFACDGTMYKKGDGTVRGTMIMVTIWAGTLLLYVFIIIASGYHNLLLGIVKFNNDGKPRKFSVGYSLLAGLPSAMISMRQPYCDRIGIPQPSYASNGDVGYLTYSITL